MVANSVSGDAQHSAELPGPHTASVTFNAHTDYLTLQGLMQDAL